MISVVNLSLALSFQEMLQLQLTSNVLLGDSRFHLLCEFDDGKRSCRRRLAGHNQRRRKPQVGFRSSGRFARFLLPYNGTAILSPLSDE